MVIKPYGYAIWEKMQAALDKMFKDTGHQNAYFPLFIPKSFFSKEPTTWKLCQGVRRGHPLPPEKRSRGKGVVVDPDAKLEEELIVRPTSETIIWNTYKGWIQSYRDLPILCNQWRTSYAGRCVPACSCARRNFSGRRPHGPCHEGGAIEEATRMIHVYQNSSRSGWRTGNRRSQIAERTVRRCGRYPHDRSADAGRQGLQSGTSHFLGQNFAKAFDVQYINKEGKLEYVWALPGVFRPV